MVIARIVGMLVGLVVGLSGWLLQCQWESYTTLALFTMIYLVIMAMALCTNLAEDFSSDSFRGFAGVLTQMHAESFFFGAWLMAAALFPLQYI